MKSILLPTDFSDNSWNAIKYAVQLYKNENCVFHLYNAYTPVIYNVEYLLIAPAQFGLGDSVRHTSQQSLERMVSRITEEFGDIPNHKYETVARFDTLVSGIKEIIEERNIELVVMGTKGATGAKEILFGSNTVQVFKNIKCPILAIPSDYKYESPTEILFPTDLEVNYINTDINIIKELSLLHYSRIHILHVSSGIDLSEKQKMGQEQIERLFKETTYLFHNIENADIPDAIAEFQIKRKIDFLTMINNKHSIFENLFFKNTINQIGFHLEIPFLVIPSGKLI